MILVPLVVLDFASIRATEPWNLLRQPTVIPRALGVSLLWMLSRCIWLPLIRLTLTALNWVAILGPRQRLLFILHNNRVAMALGEITLLALERPATISALLVVILVTGKLMRLRFGILWKNVQPLFAVRVLYLTMRLVISELVRVLRLRASLRL